MKIAAKKKAPLATTNDEPVRTLSNKSSHSEDQKPQPIQEYTVQAGDSLMKIAYMHNVR